MQEIKYGFKYIGTGYHSWGDKPCHQICLYYIIELTDENKIPLDGKFIAKEHIEGRDFNIEFHWISLTKVKKLEVYPTNANELLGHIDEGVKHFVYKEN